mgnify:CR=1 FL=1
MSRLRPFRARVGVAGAASLAALSLLVTSLTPLAVRASAAEESTQATDVVSSQDGATASSESEAAAAPAAEAAAAPAAEAGAEAPAAARDESATLAMTVVNDYTTLRVREDQITTINFSCSSVTTPCQGAVIEMTLPGPITPAGLKLIEQGYTVVPVTSDVVAKSENYVEKSADGARVQRYRFTLKDPLPAGTSDRIQIPWRYNGNDAPNNSTTTQHVFFSANNAASIEQTLSTTWTASTDVAIEKSGPTNRLYYPAVGGEATYELRYGYQQNDTTKPNSVGTRWGGTAYNGKVVGIGFQQVQNIKVVDPLPAQAVFVSASNGGVYDAATHSVTWSYDKWAYQTPIESTVTVKYPEGTVTTADTVTNKATITAEGMNEPTNAVTKSSEITHGFAERRVEARAEKIGTYNRDYARGDTLPWRFEGSNSGNTTLHYRWEDTMPCTWSSQDGKAAGDSCDQPAFVGPYEFKISTKSGYEEMGGWTFEYWTNKGNHETVTYKTSKTLTLPDGEWITRFVIETDAAPLSRPTVDLSAAVSRSVPKTEPSDFTNHYNAVLPPEGYYDTVASEDYVRIQNCASVVVTDKDTGAVALSNDNTCSWTRIRTEVPGVQVRKELNTNPVVVGKPANFMIVAEARKAVDGGTPTPFTVVDLLPEGLDVDDASNIRAESYSVLKNPDGTAYDPSKVKVEVEKNFNNTGRTLIRWIVPDPVEGAFFSRYSAKVLTTAPAGDTTNTAWAFMPGGGAKPYDQDRGVRNLKYCIRSRAQDTLDLNQDGSTTDFLCDSSVNFKIATTAGMNITKEVKGNKNDDFVPAGEIAEIDPGADGAYRFTIANAGNAPLTKVVAYDILPHPGDVGVGPAANQARESRWKPNLNSTNWTFQSVKERQGRDPEITTVPASDITIQYSTVPNPCRGEVLSVGGSMNDAPAGCTPDAWGDAPADLASITGFRIVMNRDIEVGEKIEFVATMTSPVNANLIAWNSVAMAGGVTENGKVSYLLPNEAPKVGINVSTDVEVGKSVARVKMNGDEVVRDANGLPETIESTEAIMPGDYVLYKVNLSNKGPAVASGMNVADTLPDGVEYVSSETRICQNAGPIPCAEGVYAPASYDEATGTWKAMESGILDTNLNVGGTETLYVLVKVKPGTEGSTITNTATLGDFDQIDSNKKNNTSSATFTVGGTIAGTIFNDADASWTFGPGDDKPFEGVTLRLLDADGNPVKDDSGADITTKTDADGNYLFNRLPLGSYKVEVVSGDAKVDGTDVNLSDYKQTYGYGSSTDRTQVGQGKLVTPSAIELTAAAPNATKVDFGFVKPASVGDYVWFDANKDGLQDSDEPALPDITATIVDASGNPVVDASGHPVSAVTTGADGKYKFENLLPGDYKVSFQAPAGYEATTSGAGDDRGTDSNGTESAVSLAQGQDDMTVDYGLVGTGVIGDQLFVDVNQNGGSGPDAGDKVLPNVKVTLTWTGPGGITRTFETVTDADGKYRFENLLPGEYKVSVDPETLLAAEPLLDVLTHDPSGDVDAKKVVSADVKADADKLAQAFKLSASVTLTGEKNQNLDQDWGFGVSADTAILKAITTPDEQAQESFEFIPGAKVTYTLTLTNNGPGAATGVTAVDQLPSGVSFVSAQGDGSYDPVTGVWDLSGLTLAKGEAKKVAITVVITGEGAGKLVTNVARITHQDQVGDDPTNNESSASFKGGFNLGGTIYRDSDASYSKSDSEQRFKGVTVALLGEDGTPVLDTEGNPMTTTTDENGAYQFVGLAPASYRVVIVDPDKGDLAGLIPTQAYMGRGETQAAVTITDASVQGVDFGLVAPATIGDRVWNDEDGNGVDNGEPGVPGVTVILKDASGVEVARTTTDANGNYRFTGLIPGTYTVDIEVPAGFNAATTSMTVTVGEGEENLDVDFPLTVIPAPTPTPTTTVAKILARTGSDASVLGGMAAMAAIAGFAALAGKRRRERQGA